jgi:hypothetical protein
LTADTNEDGIVTMAELDTLRLNGLGEGYRLPDNAPRGTFGDYVRVLFRFAVTFRTSTGVCVGNEPGSEEGGQPAADD